MITLQQIRDKAGVLLAIVIGLALMAFVLTDFMSSGRLLFSGSAMDVAKVGNKSITIQEYEAQIRSAEESYRAEGNKISDEYQLFSLRDQIYQQLVTDIIMESELEALGLGVHSREMSEIIQGSNPHPYIRSLFTDPNTGRFDRNTFNSFLQSIDADPSGNTRRMWQNLRKQLLGERKVQKYTNLISKGLYSPNFVLETDHENMSTTFKFSYIEKPYEWVSEETVGTITPVEEKTFYKENTYLFKNIVESRELAMVFFETKPSDNDNVSAEKWVAEIKPEFESTTDYAYFLNMNSDTPFDAKYYKKDQLSEPKDTLFDMSVGTVIGPYTEGGSIRLAKLAKTAMLSDSVKIRHIAKFPTASTAEAIKAVRDTMTLLKTQLDSGADFKELAQKVSMDPSSASTGGELGWIPYGSIQDTLFFMNKGQMIQLEMAQSIHIIQVMDYSPRVKKVQIAVLDHVIEPSNQTHQELYAKASKFIQENPTFAQFEATIQNDNSYTGQTMLRVTATDPGVMGMSSSREIVSWAFKAKPGDVSKIFELDNAYAVVSLGSIYKEGIVPFEQVRSEVNALIVRKKKAESIKAEMIAAGASSLEKLATIMKTPQGYDYNIDDSKNPIAFNAISLPGPGAEPDVIAAASVTPMGVLSAPVSGNHGVYILSVSEINKAEPMDASVARDRLDITMSGRAQGEVFPVLKTLYNVKDSRVNFY